MKENCVLKENSEYELIISIIDILNLKLNFSFKEMGFFNNVLYNLLEEKMLNLIKNLKIKLDWLELKVVEFENNVLILYLEFEDKFNISLEFF